MHVVINHRPANLNMTDLWDRAVNYLSYWFLYIKTDLNTPAFLSFTATRFA
jgi:hypothetical protein